jgi:hypothetical protein
VRYKNVAIEQVYDDTKIVAVKNVDPIPPPVDLDALIKEFKGKLRILSRLSVIYADTNISQKLEKSPHYKKYHIIAAIPTTDVAVSVSHSPSHCLALTQRIFASSTPAKTSIATSSPTTRPLRR